MVSWLWEGAAYVSQATASGPMTVSAYAMHRALQITVPATMQPPFMLVGTNHSTLA